MADCADSRFGREGWRGDDTNPRQCEGNEKAFHLPPEQSLGGLGIEHRHLAAHHIGCLSHLELLSLFDLERRPVRYPRSPFLQPMGILGSDVPRYICHMAEMRSSARVISGWSL